MKRLLGLLLVMGMIGCGGTVDESKTRVTRISGKGGQKLSEKNYKDGKQEGLATAWHENGQKKSESIFKDGKLVSETKWDEEGNEIK